MNDLETQVAQLWKEVLVTPAGTIENNSNFLDAGGDSIAATQLRTLLRERYALEVPLSELLESATVSSIATQIEQSRQGGNKAAADTNVEEGEL